MLSTLPVFDAGGAYWQEIARLLFTTWAARTGRTLPHVPVSQLSRRQIEDFWADDHLDADDADTRKSTMHTSLAAVDIIAFGDQHRDAALRRRLRATMYRLLTDAFGITGLSLDACYREDRGDGTLVVASPDIDPALLMDPLAHHLLAVVRRENRYAGPNARLRLRLAVHHGHVEYDQHGVVGDTSLELFRLLDARAFKSLFDARPDADLGLILPDRLFTETAGRSGLVTPEAYERLQVTNKGTRLKAQVWLPPVFQTRKSA
ncbi:MAG TPA: hypothetical protein VHJ17_26225 [Thermomonospora sp.]|nr:hypothetical protein [Thermomonospora sp.]